jgi:hypothetical protein
MFELSAMGHYLGEVGTITSDRIYFRPHPAPERWWDRPDEARLPLAEIPPLVFSEVMRDADLVVSVAQPEQETQTCCVSAEGC